MSSPAKKRRTSSRICFREDKAKDAEKENIPYGKKTNRISSASNKLPRKSRILSDTALLSSEISEKQRPLRRPPLANLEKNIAHGARKKELNQVANEKTQATKRTSTPATATVTNQVLPRSRILSEPLQALADIKFAPLPFKPSLANVTGKNTQTKCIFSKYINAQNSYKLPAPATVMTQALQVDRKNITVRRHLTPHHSTPLGESESDDEIFVDGDKHFFTYAVPEGGKKKERVMLVHALKHSKILSPILPNIYTSRAAVICQGIPDDVKRLSKKTTLTRRSRQRLLKADVYCLDIYSEEYLQDIVHYELRNDWKFVIRKNALMLHNSDPHPRAAVINWLIQAHDYLEHPPEVLFTTIRLLDNILASLPVPSNMYQLVGFVLMWIVSKVDGDTVLSMATKMVALCNNAYSVRQFLRMEKKLLVFLNFDLKIPDVTLFAVFHIKHLNPENKLLSNIVYYILECYALHTDFSTVTPSLQAAAAVCLALNILNQNKNVWQRLKNIVGYYCKEELDSIMQKMLEQIQYVQDPQYKYRQPYVKYATAEKTQASIVLLRKLVAT